MLEKVVLEQLQVHLDLNDITEKFQSGFKSRHSTETALLKIFNDLLLTVDSGSSAALVLLDLTAAFDTVDHQILLSRLELCVGITGNVLKWFKSYLSKRTFSVNLGQYSSAAAPLFCGVPQGSILSPILFALYLLPLGSIFKKHNISSFHLQIYLPLNSNKESTNALSNCLKDVKTWLELNFLSLNNNKTEIIVFGKSELLDGIDNVLGPLASYSRPSVRNLGVIFDNGFKFNKQISSVVKTSFFQLRLLAKVKPYLPPKDFERVIHLFIMSRLDYCNSLYFGVDQCLLRRLQLVQNAAACLLTGKRQYDHITPVLASLH